MATTLKVINVKDGAFTANGRKYVINTSLSVRRWEEYEVLQLAVSYGLTFTQMFEQDKKIYDALNKAQFVDASVILYNRMIAMKGKLDDRKHPMLYLCALFINREGEDIGAYDEKMANEKIKDWELEGFDMQSFFELALTLVTGLREALATATETISRQPKSRKNELLQKRKN